MGGAGRDISPYIKYGRSFLDFVNNLLSGKADYWRNRGIVLNRMVGMAGTINGKEWFQNGEPMRFGECVVGRDSLAEACGLKPGEVRSALEWLEKNNHIRKEERTGKAASVGTFYTITGIVYPGYYENSQSKKVDDTSGNGEKHTRTQPTSTQKQPTPKSENDVDLSAFSDAGGAENNQDYITGPVGNRDIRTKDSNIRPKTRSRANFEQFRSPQMLENYILSATQRSKHERNKYNCPFCGSGTKKNGTGALSINKRDGGGKRWRCFACQRHGDIFDFAGYLHNTEDRYEQLSFVSEYFRGHGFPLPS